MGQICRMWFAVIIFVISVRAPLITFPLPVATLVDNSWPLTSDFRLSPPTSRVRECVSPQPQTLYIETVRSSDEDWIKIPSLCEESVLFRISQETDKAAPTSTDAISGVVCPWPPRPFSSSLLSSSGPSERFV